MLARFSARSAALRNVSWAALQRLVVGRRVVGVGRADLGLGDPEQALVGQARLLVHQRLQRLLGVGELLHLHLAEALPQLRLGRQRRGRELLAERREPRQRLAELAVLVLHDAEEEAGAGDVVGRRVAHQRFETGLLVGVVLEAVGLLERLGRLLLLLLVVVDHALVLGRRLGAFAVVVVDAGQEVAGVRAVNGIGERRPTG